MVDGTQPLPGMGAVILDAEKRRRSMSGGKIKHVSLVDLQRIVLRLITEHGSRAAPVTVSYLETRVTARRANITHVMAHLTKGEKHLHRQLVDSGRFDKRGHKISEFGYWIDASAINPHFGKKFLWSTKQESVESAHPPADPEPVVASDTVTVAEFAAAIKAVNRFARQPEHDVELEIEDGWLKGRIVQRFE